MNRQGYNSARAAPCSQFRLFGVDIQLPPGIEYEEEVGGPVISLRYGGQGGHPSNPLVPPTLLAAPVQPAAPAPPAVPAPPAAPAPAAPINVEDDDVIVSSPRAFEEARLSSRRLQDRTPVVDMESEEITAGVNVNRRSQRRRLRARRTIIISSDQFVNLEGMEESNGSMESAQPVSPPIAPPPPPSPSPPPPSPEPTFTCPVCMGPLVEEVTTKCGHIFCKGCIMTAIAVAPKCPTCRRKVTKRGIMRIYLPNAN